eukprot:1192760-Pyramimonas_sp.AAC.1
MKIEDLTKIYCEVLCSDSGHCYAWKELYEVPGGDQVRGSPPAPVEGYLTIHFEKADFSHL